MLILLWLLMGLNLGWTIDVSPQHIELSINRTIDTVEKMIKKDPTLPQLSRNDVLNILHNITSENSQLSEIEKMTRDAYKRALLIVLPHSANNAQETLKELYTKPPLIQMIPNSAEADAIVEIGKTQEIVFPPHPKDPSPFTENSYDNSVAQSTHTATKSDIQVECKEVTQESHKNHRHSYSDFDTKLSMLLKKTNESKKVNTEPERFTFNLSNLDQITKSAQEYISSTRLPVSKGMTTDMMNNESLPRNNKVAVVYSSSVTTKPSTESYAKSIPSMKPSDSHDHQSYVVQSDQWRFFAPPPSNNQNSEIIQMKQPLIENHFLPTVPNSPESFNSFFELPQKKVSSDHSMTDEVEHLAPVYVTPMTSTPSEKLINMEHETLVEHNMNNIPPTSGGFSIATNVVTSVKPIDMLESLGFRVVKKEEQGKTESNTDVKTSQNIIDTKYNTADSKNEMFYQPMNPMHFNSPNSENYDMYRNIQMGSNMGRNDGKSAVLTPFVFDISSVDYQKNFNMTQPDMKNIHSNIQHSQPVGLTAFSLNSPSITSQNTFENPQVEFKKSVNNLSPDVRLLFQRFGLPTSFNSDNDLFKTTTTSRPTTMTSYVDSFTNFKRIPTSSIENKEMQDFLAQFGLGNGESRNQKSMRTRDNIKEYPKMEEVSFDMRKALENIGLLALLPKADKGVVKSAPKSTASTKIHVFKPHETSLSSEEQKQKINKLLSTVKMVQEGKIQDVTKVVTDLVQTTKLLKSGPDPVDLDEILKLYNEDMKSQIKKQRQATFEEFNETETSTESSEKELDLSTASSMINNEAPSSTPKPSIFDTLDISEFLNQTDNVNDKTEENISALEESFGGSTETPDPVLPTRPKTGLYFLVDWNTFLEVGEDGKDKVNLRFQPKAGDRTRFVPVKIP